MREVVIVLGAPASGKTTVAEEYVAEGYARLNRDRAGGTIADLLPKLDSLLSTSSKGVVLDNLYTTAQSRKGVIDVAKKHDVPIKCVWQSTNLEDSQYNSVSRMVRKYGRLLSPVEIKENGKNDPNCFPPAVLFAYRKDFQKPEITEGFTNIEYRPFIRKIDPTYTGKALILDKDGTLTQCHSGGKFPCTADDVRVINGRGDKLNRYAALGYRLLGVSNQSGVAKGDLSEDTLKAILATTNKLLGTDIEWAYCPHKVPPISCYCRKPSSGLGVQFIERYKLNPAQCIFVGDAGTDESFAKRCGFKYIDESIFFTDRIQP
jgi:HAD superfamily hydrolase (TIGR01662 family)